jgi:hypothetical protein
MNKIPVILAALALASPLAAEEWHREAIDSCPSGYDTSSLALDGLGHPRLAYRTADVVRYASWDGQDWSYDTIVQSSNLRGQFDLMLDTDGYVHVAYCTLETDMGMYWMYYNYTYFDEDGPHDSEILSTMFYIGPYISLDLDADRYAHVSPGYMPNCYAYWDGESWHLERAPGCGDIAIDGSGRPTIATCWTNDELTFAVRESEGWTEEMVDADVSSNKASLAYDSQNRPHVAYYDSDSDDLRYAHHDGSAWHVETVDSGGDVGNYCSLALDSSDLPHIAYYDADEDDLIYTRYSGGEWHREVVDSVGSVHLGASLALDAYDRPHISYYNDTLGAVMYAALVEDVFHLVWPGKREEVDTADPTLDWEDHEIPDQESYTLRWSQTQDFHDYEEVTGITESEYQLTGLGDGNRYWWRVMSVDSGGGGHWAEEMDWYFDVELPDGVDIVDLVAEATDGGVLIGWRHEGGGPVGLGILRSDDGAAPIALLDEPLPGSASRYLDTDVIPGVGYAYWLEVTEADGTVTRFGPTETVSVSRPDAEATLSAYPNPADDAVTIRYGLPTDGRVTLSVYDLSGRRVATLAEGERAAGRHEVVWDCADVRPGVYLCRLETTGGELTERLLVTR